MDQVRPSPSQAGRVDAILVVDDDAQVLKYLSRMLGSIGYTRIFQASTREEALALWQEHRPEIELVICDFVMPETTGDRLAIEMLEQKPELKVLIISGNDAFTLDSAIPLAPGRNFLQKPFTVADIRRSVDNLSFSA